MVPLIVLLVLAQISTTLAASWIVPGAVWTDTAGNKIDAHGGQIVQREKTFYWIGQSASQDEIPLMYSSTDLLNWTPLGAQSSLQYLWRPKIAKPNGSFWIYGQLNRNIQPLLSSTMVGGYQVHGSPVTVPPNSYTYSDTGMFEDSDGTWYILTSADHNTIQINKINSDGTIGARASALTAGAYEAPGLLQVDSTYFLIASGKTGWRSNPNKVFTSSSINGPWAGGADIAPEAENTYNSQNTFELTIKGSQTTTYIYMGDSWDSKGGPTSNYVWLPMSVSSSAKTLSLQYHAMWKIDVSTGAVSFPSTSKRYEAADATISGRAAPVSCNHCMKKRTVSKVDSSSQVTFRNVNGTGKPQWVSFHYSVNDPESGEAHIFINDEQVPTNISSLNSRAGYHKTVPVELTLRRGVKNSIRFGVSGPSGFEADIEGVEVHDDEE